MKKVSMTTKEHILAALEDARIGLENLMRDDAALAAIGEAARLMAETIRGGGTVWSCGNGGASATRCISRKK